MNSIGNIESLLKNLDKKQFKCIDDFYKGKNVFITGPAGTGKSHLINIISLLCNINRKICNITALTGCAAQLLTNARTLHSFSGIQVDNFDTIQNIEKILKKNQRAKRNWIETEVLIVDEISMMSKNIFDLLNDIAKNIRKKSEPWGGIQLVFCGDFFQLPPVDSNEDSSGFCFNSNDWKVVFKPENVHIFSKIFRQTDQSFQDILSGMRIGKLSKEGVEILQSRQIKYDGENPPTILLSKRSDVDRINKYNHDKLGSVESVKYLNIIKEPTCEQISSNNYKKCDITHAIKQFKNNGYTETIEFKLGSQVICIKNISENIVNGSRGKIVGFEGINKYPKVAFINGITEVMVPYEMPHNTIQGLSFKEIPLMLAWALTIHKCQGMSIDLCQMDLGHSIFEDGQAYVAISRVRSLEGLFITNFNISSIRANKAVFNFYNYYIKKLKKLKKKNKQTKQERKQYRLQFIEMAKTNEIEYNQNNKTQPIEVITNPNRTIIWTEEIDKWLLKNRDLSGKDLYDKYVVFKEDNECESDNGIDNNNNINITIMMKKLKKRLIMLIKREDKLFKELELESIPIDYNLYKQISSYRYSKSVEYDKPLYIIMTNAVINSISRLKPISKTDLGKIKGVGPSFIEKYSDDVLEIINKHT